MINWIFRSPSKSKSKNNNAWQANQLERRIMLDGTGDVASTGDAVEIAEVSPAPLTTTNDVAATSSELVFIDAQVTDAETLRAGVTDRAEIILLDAHRDAVEQITQTLAKRRNVSSVHLVAHGREGELHFAKGQLNLAQLSRHDSQIRQWSDALTANADILIYGCDVAHGQVGSTFVQRLAEVTGADVAASVDKTGAAANAADWDLEKTVGAIDSQLAFSVSSQEAFSDVLLVVDFEDLSSGPQGSQFDNTGYQFTDGGWNSFDLQVYGTGQGYGSNVLHSQHYSRTITLDRIDGQAFNLASFDYAAGRFGTTDATVTGTRTDGSQLTAAFESDTKSLQTLGLNWNDLESVIIDFRGGANDVFGAVDNFDVNTGGTPTEAVIALSSDTQNVGEGDGNATIGVTRTGDISTSVTVDFTTNAGTATADDFTSTSGTLTFAAGQTAATISVPIADDVAAEGNETFSVNLSSPSTEALLGNAFTSINIIDNDSSGTTETIDFEDLSTGLQGSSVTTQGFVFEDAGYGSSSLRVYDASAGYSDQVLHSDNWNRAIRMTQADGAPFDLVSFDYGAGRWNTLTDANVVGTFADGSTDSRTLSTSTKTLETLSLNWSNLQSVEIDFRGGGTNAYGALDNFQVGGGGPVSQPGTISLTVDQITIDESANALNVIFFRGDGSDGTVTVDYSTVAGTAGVEDFQSVSGTLAFADGITGGQISIPILDDVTPESAEGFSIVISNPTGGATLGGITTQSVTITDNDEVTAGILFEDSFEGSTVWTTNPSDTDTATTGAWEAATPQSTISGTTTLQLDAGATGSRALVTGAAAGSSAGAFDIDNGTTSVMSPTIALPDAAEIELSFAYYLAYLDNATADDYFEVAILADGVETEIYDDHAHNANQSAAWQTRTIDLSAYAGQSINVIFEAADAAGGSLIEAGVDDVVIEVLPTLPGTIDIATTGVNIDETAGTAEVTIRRTSGRVGTVTVDYATVSGTATADQDYTPQSGTATFLDGQAEVTISIPIIDDAADEDLETFELQLTNPTGGALLGTDITASITIADNDSTAGDYLPDMMPIASTLTERLSIDTSEQPGRQLMRFSTEVANAGNGPLEIWGGSVSGSSQQVFQRIYQDDGGSRDRLAGEFVYHPGHGHIHFEAFATYDLRLVSGTGDIIASGGKTSFCLINIGQPLPDVTANAAVVDGRGGTSCGQIQGISAGYSDVYSASLDDQWIDITDVADGTYWLEIETDPDNNIQESDETNNVARVQVTISNGEVSGG